MAILSKDVYRGFKFSVELSGGGFTLSRAAFQKVTGMKSSVEVVEYREGNMPDRMEKMAGMMTYDTVTLERGISYDDDFNNWMKLVCDGTSATGTIPSSSSASDVGEGSYRCDVIVTLYNKQAQAVKKYTLLDAWPSEYTIGDFDATSNDVVISTLVLQHHGIKEEDLLAQDA
jgi:phage tail-like protein